MKADQLGLKISPDQVCKVFNQKFIREFISLSLIIIEGKGDNVVTFMVKIHKIPIPTWYFVT